MIPLQHIDNTWTLFLDRDGVINHQVENDYIHHWRDFVFYEDAIEAIRILSGIFNRIIVVTNQKGVGKGLTKESDLLEIHENMIAEVVKCGGRIDDVFYCPDIGNDSPNRKPNPGMGLQAKARYPEIDFSKTIMVGNSPSDMEFGRNLGTYNVFINTTHPEINTSDERVDMCFSSLYAFSSWLKS